MNDVPVWLKNIAAVWGFDADQFLSVFKAAAEKFDVPQQAQDAVATWVETNVKSQVSPERILALVAFAYAELRSGAPGMNPDHGGLA